MGVYTELVISTLIKNDPKVIEILKFMLGEGPEPKELPNHDLFKTDRWRIMLKCSSYYHVPYAMHYFSGEQHKFSDDSCKAYRWDLIVRCDFKDYGDESVKFFDWIKPYCGRPEQMIGYTLYEEDKDPIIYYADGYPEDGE